MKKVALLGTGAMGERMAQRLLANGHQVAVYNRTASRADGLVQAGARAYPTPRQAVADAELVISMVRDDEASKQVWLDPTDGAILGLSKGCIAIESSTLTPDWSERLAAEVDAFGARFLDAPVAGSRPQAEAGQLIYLVGGCADALAEARAVLDCMGGAIHHVGGSGAGTRAKLAVNAFFAAQVAALAEVSSMLVAGGLPLGESAALISALPITSPALKGIAASFAAGQFAPMFPIELVEKDLRYAVQTATTLGTSCALLESTHEAFQRAVEAGYGGDHISGIYQLMQS